MRQVPKRNQNHPQQVSLLPRNPLRVHRHRIKSTELQREAFTLSQLADDSAMAMKIMIVDTTRMIIITHTFTIVVTMVTLATVSHAALPHRPPTTVIMIHRAVMILLMDAMIPNPATMFVVVTICGVSRQRQCMDPMTTHQVVHHQHHHHHRSRDKSNHTMNHPAVRYMTATTTLHNHHHHHRTAARRHHPASHHHHHHTQLDPLQATTLLRATPAPL